MDKYRFSHADKTCTYDDPRQSTGSEHDNGSCVSLSSAARIEPPPQRTYKITRHPEIGFGFVAASQRPVLIQFVTPGRARLISNTIHVRVPHQHSEKTALHKHVVLSGGPSDGKLLTNDQILTVNGIDARSLQKEEVVALVRETLNELHITVTQPTGKQVRVA